MYQVLSKDTISLEILPYLSVAKRGFTCKADTTEVINGILYKLKTGIQWHMLPVKSLFSDVVLAKRHCSTTSENGARTENGSICGQIF